MKLQFGKFDLICSLGWMETEKEGKLQNQLKTTYTQISVYTREHENLRSVFGKVGGIYKDVMEVKSSELTG